MARKRRRQPIVRLIGLFLVVVLLVTGVVLFAASRFPLTRTGKTATKSTADYIRAEIKGLEKLLQEDIRDSRIMGKTDAQIEEIKAKYQAELDRLRGDIEKLEQDKKLEQEKNS